jgi:hypothetical protein
MPYNQGVDEQPVTRRDLVEALATAKVEITEAVTKNVTEVVTKNVTEAVTKNVTEAVTRNVTEAVTRNVTKNVTEALRDFVMEAVRDSQTEVLKAFLPYQESSNVRMRALEAKLSNVDSGLSERVSIVERRLQELEKRFLQNPPAA